MGYDQAEKANSRLCAMKKMPNKLRRNHNLMMLVCCGMPLVLLVILVYFFGLNKNYLVWFLILLCPIMHFFMMRGTHQESGKNQDTTNKANNKAAPAAKEFL